MTCMTTKKKFDVEDPEVVLLRNNRYAFKTPCPWEGKNGKKLVAFKFCSGDRYKEYQNRIGSAESEQPAESELADVTVAENEHSDVEVE